MDLDNKGLLTTFGNNSPMSKENFNEKLIELLKTNPDFTDESDELIPAAVKDHAWKLDPNLIRLLLSDIEIKSTFFNEIDGHWVFNHNTLVDNYKDAIILDFFGGSGTTAHAVLELNKDGGNRKFICEQMHYVESVTVPRVKKVIEKQGGGDFIYCELMQYNQIYMDKIQAAQSSTELVALCQEIAENSFLNWYVNAEMSEDAVKDFKDIDDLESQKHLLVELLDKNQLYVNLSEIEDTDFAVSARDKTLNREFFEGSS